MTSYVMTSERMTNNIMNKHAKPITLSEIFENWVSHSDRARIPLNRIAPQPGIPLPYSMQKKRG